MSNLEKILARQCAVSRCNFGPNERRKGVIDHIKEEFDEIEAAVTQSEVVREWADVAILAHDGLLRACREHLRQLCNGENCVDEDGKVTAFEGEPTNDYVAAYAAELYQQKLAKNELREWPDWRKFSGDVAINHTRGTHD